MGIYIEGMKMPVGEDEGLLIAVYDGKAYQVGTNRMYNAIEISTQQDDKTRCRCGGRLSEVRYHNGRPYRHCFDCHREYYEDGDNL